MKTCEHKTRAIYESYKKQVCIDCGFEMPLHDVCKVSELAKTFNKSRNQIRGLVLKHHIKPVAKQPNIYGGITNFYNLEDFNHANA
ncbi:MAG: hypothetical protein PHQ03_07395 [Methylococcales bacterium]|nr:hypothetical protein [Methylococcales bacterium]